MKKIALIITALFIGFMAFAQAGLDGTWYFEEKQNDSGGGKEVNAVFMIRIDGSHSGTLSRQGEIINLTPSSKEKPKVEVTSDVKGIPGGGLLKNMLVAPLKKEINSVLKETESYKVISVTADELVLEEVLTDKEISKGQSPEQVTFKRK